MSEETALLQEAARLADLRHPHVVSLYGVFAGQDSETRAPAAVMVMELCARGDLRSLLVVHRAEKWPASEVLVRWTSEVAEGVAFVHSKGVVHRDLRAQNVLVQAVDVEGKQLVAKVGDFGLALAADTTQRGGVGGAMLPLR
jgi:serine/threonine protein kinase